MELRTDVPLPFPRARVFTTYRDRLDDLLVYLPDIRGYEKVKREERPGEVLLVNKWKGGGEIPAVARSFLNESMLSWTDHATWRETDWVCSWRTDIHAFPGALLASGTHRFVETPTGCRIEFRGDIKCDSAKVPGVPRLLAGSINPAIEKLFVGKIGENLAGVGRGIGKLLEKDG